MDRGSWHCTESSEWLRPSARKRNAKRKKWLSEEALQIAVKRREAKRQKRKGNLYPFECRVLKSSKERWESVPQWPVQRNRGKQ